MEQNNSNIVMEVCLLTYNLETECQVKESLETLEHKEFPVELLREHKVMELAKRYMMSAGVEEQARRLLAKMRRIEGVSSRKSPNEEAKKSPIGDEMTVSKRTAPVKYEGKRRGDENGSPKIDEEEQKGPISSEEERKKELRKAEQDEKLQKFLAKKKATVGRSRTVLLPTEALPVRKETGKWPVNRQPSKSARKTFY